VNVLVLNQYFHPDQSATSQLLTELCEDLAEGNEVTVVTGRPSYNPVERSAARGLIARERHGRVDVRRAWSTTFDRSSMTRRLLNYGTYLTTSVLAALSVRKPDVVVALTDPPPIGLVGAMVARLRRVPFVLVTKDIFPDVAIRLGRLRNPWIVRTLRAESSLLYRNATRVVSIGRDMTERLLELGVRSAKIATIHDWADGRAVVPLTGPSAMRAEHGWGSRFVVMHSGNVGLSQELGTILEAAAILRDREDVLFVIVGDGAAKAALERDARERGLGNVRFLPYQPKAYLSQSLGAADVHVVSLARGLAGYIVPSKVYGIMAAGRPFIAAVEPDSEPALIAGEVGCGLVVPPGDAEALAAAILRARDAEDLAAMGRRGREAMERRFDRKVAVSAYRRLLGELVNRNPPDGGSPD
jgi:glycosyltransferase involved in cell wall biosynthesis